MKKTLLVIVLVLLFCMAVLHGRVSALDSLGGCDNGEVRCRTFWFGTAAVLISAALVWSWLEKKPKSEEMTNNFLSTYLYEEPAYSSVGFVLYRW